MLDFVLNSRARGGAADVQLRIKGSATFTGGRHLGDASVPVSTLNSCDLGRPRWVRAASMMGKGTLDGA